jgi:hypothetical protein
MDVYRNWTHSCRSISRMSHIETQPHGLDVRGKSAINFVRIRMAHSVRYLWRCCKQHSWGLTGAVLLATSISKRVPLSRSQVRNVVDVQQAVALQALWFRRPSHATELRFSQKISYTTHHGMRDRDAVCTSFQYNPIATHLISMQSLTYSSSLAPLRLGLDRPITKSSFHPNINYSRPANKAIHLSTGSETNARVGSVVDGVVVLQELLANDGVDARAATVGDPGVVLARGDTEVAVLGSGDQVLGGSQRVGG